MRNGSPSLLVNQSGGRCYIRHDLHANRLARLHEAVDQLLA